MIIIQINVDIWMFGIVHLSGVHCVCLDVGSNLPKKYNRGKNGLLVYCCFYFKALEANDCRRLRKQARNNNNNEYQQIQRKKKIYVWRTSCAKNHFTVIRYLLYKMWNIYIKHTVIKSAPHHFGIFRDVEMQQVCLLLHKMWARPKSSLHIEERKSVDPFLYAILLSFAQLSHSWIPSIFYIYFFVFFYIYILTWKRTSVCWH